METPHRRTPSELTKRETPAKLGSDEILAWHHSGRPSNGRIEGTNNLLQVLRRTAHGFTNTANFEARGLLVT